MQQILGIAIMIVLIILCSSVFTSRFVLLEEEVNKVFEEDGLSWQGFSALQGLKQFMYSGTDGIPLAIVSFASYIHTKFC